MSSKKAVQKYAKFVDLGEGSTCGKNEFLVAKIGLDTTENEPSEVS